MNSIIAELTNLANGSAASGDKLAAKTCADAIIELERLERELVERTKAARYITCCLGGAGDDSEDGWDHDNIRSLFKLVCKRWPWCDPTKAAEAAREATDDK